MTKSGNTHYWSDAWLLLAVGFATTDHPATLGSVITIADGIQHALITREELNGGIARLERAGYLAYDGMQFTLTALGRAAFDDSAQGGAAHSKRQSAIAREFGAMPWSSNYSPRDALAGESEAISDAEYRMAAGVGPA